MKKVISIGIRIYLVIVALLLLNSALGLIFTPDTTLQTYRISAEDGIGMNILRGDMGGLALALAIFLIMSVVKGDHWNYALITLMGTVLSIRTMSFLQGETGSTIILIMVIETLVILGAVSLLYFEKN